MNLLSDTETISLYMLAILTCIGGYVSGLTIFMLIEFDSPPQEFVFTMLFTLFWLQVGNYTIIRHYIRETDAGLTRKNMLAVVTSLGIGVALGLLTFLF